MGKGVDHISTKKMGVSAYSRCPLCKEDEESIDHLLLIALQFGAFVQPSSPLPKLIWACPPLVKDLMLDWTTFPIIRKKARKPWKAALPSLLWAIWKERNKVVFDNDSFSPIRLKHL